MPNTFTNLLPLTRQRTFLREYYVRLSVIILYFVSTLACIAMILLVPTYVFLIKSAGAKEDQLAALESVRASVGDTTLSARLVALSNSSIALSTLGKTASASALIRSVLALTRLGVTLTNFGYSPAAGNTPGTLSITGTAATRDALRNYQLALQGASFAHVANLPVSAYAKDSDIAFTITVTLSP